MHIDSQMNWIFEITPLFVNDVVVVYLLVTANKTNKT